MKSQNATATLGTITSCAGENVLVPLDVMDFYGVGAMTFYIGYDTNAVEFLSIENINPAVPGGISANASNGQVGIVYSYTEPFDLSGEKLFDLNFTFLNGNTDLTFNPGTEIATVDLVVIPLDTYAGSIINSIQIIDQPTNVLSSPDHDVNFEITAQGDINYQWQENSGDNWINLQNNSTYSGVNTNSLLINDISLQFNGYDYRCILTADECTEISSAAELQVETVLPVATLGYVSTCPESQLSEPLSVADFLDVIEFSFNLSYDTANLLFVGLENIHPALGSGTFSFTLPENNPGITIHWTGITPVSINSDNLFDLKFIYNSQMQMITFEDGTFVMNSFANLVDISLVNGTIEQYISPEIITQPQDQTVLENDEVSFSIEANDVMSYSWMESNNGGVSWYTLNDTPPYYNTHTAVLTIHPAFDYLDGYLYACRLNSEFCTVTSSAAVLTVDTLTFIRTLNQKEHFMIYPVPFDRVAHIYSENQIETIDIKIINLQGVVCAQYTLYNIQNEISLNLSGLPEGMYLITAEGISKGQVFSEKHKILKMR